MNAFESLSSGHRSFDFDVVITEHAFGVRDV